MTSQTTTRKTNFTPAVEQDAQTRASVRSIRELFLALPEDVRARVLQELSSPNQIPTPRAGTVLGTMARILSLRVSWSVPEIKEKMAETGVEALPKDIYNAIGYLTRRGYVRRVGYGRYVVEGAMLTTAEDLGGEPGRNED